MCSPPNPKPSHKLLSPAGDSMAAAPSARKPAPIMGTTRTENAPPVMTPVPYSSSHVPGIKCSKPARHKAKVRSAPANIGGTKLKADVLRRFEHLEVLVQVCWEQQTFAVLDLEFPGRLVDAALAKQDHLTPAFHRAAHAFPFLKGSG